MKKRIIRTQQYYDRQNKVETMMPDHKVMWQIDMDRFDLTCYFYGGAVRSIVQNFYDGSAVYVFLSVNGNKYSDIAKSVGLHLCEQ